MNEREELRIAGIVRESIVDGPGMRFVVFVQGCPHHCPGCHNPQSHPFEGGSVHSVERIFREICKNPMIRGVTFSGGEPSCQPKAFLALAREICKRGLNIWMYSGYTLEELFRFADPNGSGHAARDKRWEDPSMRAALRELLKTIDVLIDGPFIMAERSLELQFRGSRNQRIIDVKKSLAAGKIILWEEFKFELPEGPTSFGGL